MDQKAAGMLNNNKPQLQLRATSLTPTQPHDPTKPPIQAS